MRSKIFIFIGLFLLLLGNIYTQELELLPAVAFLDRDVSAVPIWAINGKTCDINYIIRGGTPPYKVKWDFWDGTPSEVKDYLNRKFISVQHTYNLPSGKYRDQYTLKVYVTDAQNRTVTGKRNVAVLRQEDWNEDLNLQRMIIISKAMWYLHSNLHTSSDIPRNALFLQLLVNCGHNPFEFAKEDGYIEDAQAALRFLESSLAKFEVGYGPEFDCNGNGRLIKAGDTMYIQPIVLMALSSVLANLSKNARAKATLTFDKNVVPLEVICQDMAEMTLAAQNPGGGWRYTPRYGNTDFSVTQWPVIALHAWEHSQKTIPSNMVPKLQQAKKWLLTYMTGNENLGSSGGLIYNISDYTIEKRWTNTALTGSGLCCAAWVGLPYNNSMVLGFRDFIYQRWGSLTCIHTPAGAPIDAYAYYAIMKGMRNYEQVFQFAGSRLSNSAGAFKDWHDDFTRKLAQYQTANGDWGKYPSHDAYGEILCAELFALCILPRIYESTPISIIKSIPAEDFPLNVIFDHSESLSGDPQMKIKTYRWDFGDNHREESSNQFEQRQHTYSQPGTYEVTLTTSFIKDNRLLEGKTKKKITVQANPNHAGRFLPPPMSIGPFAQKTRGQIALVKLNREIYPNKTWDDNIIVTLGDMSNSPTPIQISAGKVNYLAIAVPDSLESPFTINWGTQNNTLTPCLLKTYLIERSSLGDWPRNFQGKPFIQLTNVPEFSKLYENEEIKLKGTLFLLLDQPGENKWEANLDFKGISQKLFALTDKAIGDPQSPKSIGIKGAKLALFDPKSILISSPIKASADIPIEWINGDRDENQLILLRKTIFKELEQIK